MSMIVIMIVIQLGTPRCYEAGFDDKDIPNSDRALIKSFVKASKRKSFQTSVLGEGVTGKVILYKHNGRDYAVKRIDFASLLLEEAGFAHATWNLSLDCGMLIAQRFLRIIKKHYIRPGATSIKDIGKTGRACAWEFGVDPTGQNILEYIAHLENFLDKFIAELDLNERVYELSQTTLPNFRALGYFGCYYQENTFFMFLERGKSDLHASEFRGNFIMYPLANRLRLYLSMSLQVYYFQRLGYLHCDMKLDNFMLAMSSYTDVYLMDFGEVAQNGVCTGGNIQYASPERFRFDPRRLDPEAPRLTPAQLKKSDIWGLGLIIFALEFSPPYLEITQLSRLANDATYDESDVEQEDLEEEIHNAFAHFKLELDQQPNSPVDRIVPLFRELIKGMVQVDVQHRISAKQVVLQLFKLYQLSQLEDVNDFDGFANQLDDWIRNKHIHPKTMDLLNPAWDERDNELRI